MNAREFTARKQSGPPLVLTTCYSAWSARIIVQSGIDAVLVGDSVAMTVYGHESTIPATTDTMARHTEAVVRGAPDAFVIADLPFLSFRKGVAAGMDAVEMLMRAGAGAVKLEGFAGHEELVRHIVDSGVPVMGHVGMTPQSVNTYGGFRVQGLDDESAAQTRSEAQRLNDAGAFGIVVECVPAALAKEITETTTVPTIGIGAGPHVDGQILVLHDLLGLSGFQPRFVRQYLDGAGLIRTALEAYVEDVRQARFPDDQEGYG